MKIQYYLFLVGMLMALALPIAHADMNQVNFSSPYTTIPNNSALVVQTLKYDPYPVNAGEWFDVWVQVQNVGQQDAPNVTFTLAPDYPFSSNDSLVRNYGVLLGTESAYKAGAQGDGSTVILEYRVKVADNAPEGTSNLKFYVTNNASDPNAPAVGTNLPVVVGKTKTDFDVVMQSSTAQGTSFAISNIGANDATAVTVALDPQQGYTVVGPQSSIIGNLARGDFTTVTFQIAASGNFTPGRNFNSTGMPPAGPGNVTVKISYTDSVGIRNTVEKSVPVSLNYSSMFSGTRFARTSGAAELPFYAYLIIGMLVGSLAVFGYNRLTRKK